MSECAAGLIVNKKEYTKNLNRSLHYYNLIEKDNFSASERGAGLEIFGLSPGGVTDAFASYDDFSSERDRLFKEIEFNYSESDSIAYLSEGVNDKVIEGYFECLKAEKTGLHLDIVYADHEKIQVRAEWRVRDAVSDAKVTFEVKDLEGTKTKKKKLQTTFKANQKDILTFERLPNSDFHLTLDHENYDAVSITLKAPYKPKKGHNFYVASFWWGSSEIENAEEVYVKNKLYSLRPGPGEREQTVYPGTHAGNFFANFKVNEKGEYLAQIVRDDGRLLAIDRWNYRDYDSSKASWVDNDSFHIPANYHLEVKRIT